MAYGNYNVVFLVVMTLWVTMSMSISMLMTLGTLMIGEEEDGSYYSSEPGRMSFIGVLSLSYQLNLTNFWKNFFCTLNSFSAATLRGGNSCLWGLLIIVRNFDFLGTLVMGLETDDYTFHRSYCSNDDYMPSCTHEVDMIAL